MGVQLLDKKRNVVVEVASEQSANSLVATGHYELIKQVKQTEAKLNTAKPNDQRKPAGKQATGRETSDQPRKPELKKQINISQDRNLSICVWPPGGQYNTRSVTLQESRRDESGKWTNTKILVNGREFEFLFPPTGAQLLALSKYLEQVWEYPEQGV